MIRHRIIDRRHLVMALCAGLLLSACNSDNVSDLREFVENTKTKYSGQVEPLPEIPPYRTHRYAMAQKRDPFRPSIANIKAIAQSQSQSKIRPDTERRKEELEQYGLNELTMVGVLENDGETWAVIRAPDKTVYRVRKGNYMGKNFGQITKITESKIQLVEIVPDGLGGWMERPNSLSLSE